MIPDSSGFAGEGNEMHRIRCAEQVILWEEERHGRYGRDRTGNLTVVVVADADVREQEINADNFTQLSQKSNTTRHYAPLTDLARIGHTTTSKSRTMTHVQSP